MKIFPLRLKPDLDLKESLKDFVDLNNIKAGFILTAVGSLKQAKIRFANSYNSQFLTEKFEIISLVGTISTDGIHLHIALADQNGKTIGGHLDNGCIIYTTAEIVIGASEEFTFIRTIEKQTGFKELEILSSTQSPS